MDEKKKILEKLMPQAVLKAVTPAAQKAVTQAAIVDGIVPMREFPFRVGRESRVKIIDGRIERIERIERRTEPSTNDLYLFDNAGQLHISREHFQIERDGNSYYLFDRGSRYGTVIGEREVGGDREEDSARLSDGDTITIGPKGSPYVFQFILLHGFTICSRNQEQLEREGSADKSIT